MILDKNFYLRDSVTVAKELLGKVLVYKNDGKVYRARITETEAYTGFLDKASHAYNGRRTERTETMFKEGGILYIYLTYGMYNMLNIVTGEKDYPDAVLIRGIEPIENIDYFSENRYCERYENLNNYKKKNMTNGPGKLTKSLKIDRKMDGYSVVSDKIYIEDDGFRAFKIEKSKRIGIDYAEEWKDKELRFFIK